MKKMSKTPLLPRDRAALTTIHAILHHLTLSFDHLHLSSLIHANQQLKGASVFGGGRRHLHEGLTKWIDEIIFRLRVERYEDFPVLVGIVLRKIEDLLARPQRTSERVRKAPLVAPVHSQIPEQPEEDDTADFSKWPWAPEF